MTGAIRPGWLRPLAQADAPVPLCHLLAGCSAVAVVDTAWRRVGRTPSMKPVTRSKCPTQKKKQVDWTVKLRRQTGFLLPSSAFLCIYIFALQNVHASVTSVIGRSRASNSFSCS